LKLRAYAQEALARVETVACRKECRLTGPLS
jgi:hypothetical protein